MAAMRSINQILRRKLFDPSSSFRLTHAVLIGPIKLVVGRPISFTPIRAAAAGKTRPSARLAQVQELIFAAQKRSKGANEPIPKVALEHVTVNFARSSGPGGQNVNKVNTKVDMRFNVKNAYWLCERVKEKILQMEKNRINKDGELVITSTKSRTQKGNIEDALEKLQVIIDAASYVPPPPSQEQVKKIQDLAAIGEKKRLDKKRENSLKKAARGNRGSWD